MPVSFHFAMFLCRADRSSSPSAANGVVIGNKRPLSSVLESRVVRVLFDDCSNKMRGIIAIVQCPMSNVQCLCWKLCSDSFQLQQSNLSNLNFCQFQAHTNGRAVPDIGHWTLDIGLLHYFEYF